MLFARTALVGFCLALAAALTAAPATAGEVNPHLGRHVRGATPQINDLIDQGVRRSQTFAELVEALNATDVVVYLSTSRTLPRGLDGRLAFMTTAGEVRYLHAQILEGLGLDEAIAITAHELQHALEVAEHREVRDAAGLGALYERIGERSHHPNRFDTSAARQKGRRVRHELS